MGSIRIARSVEGPPAPEDELVLDSTSIDFMQLGQFAEPEEQPIDFMQLGQAAADRDRWLEERRALAAQQQNVPGEPSFVWGPDTPPNLFGGIPRHPIPEGTPTPLITQNYLGSTLPATIVNIPYSAVDLGVGLGEWGATGLGGLAQLLSAGVMTLDDLAAPRLPETPDRERRKELVQSGMGNLESFVGEGGEMARAFAKTAGQLANSQAEILGLRDQVRARFPRVDQWLEEQGINSDTFFEELKVDPIGKGLFALGAMKGGAKAGRALNKRVGDAIRPTIGGDLPHRIDPKVGTMTDPGIVKLREEFRRIWGEAKEGDAKLRVVEKERLRQEELAPRRELKAREIELEGEAKAPELKPELKPKERESKGSDEVATDDFFDPPKVTDPKAVLDSLLAQWERDVPEAKRLTDSGSFSEWIKDSPSEPLYRAAMEKQGELDRARASADLERRNKARATVPGNREIDAGWTDKRAVLDEMKQLPPGSWNPEQVAHREAVLAKKLKDAEARIKAGEGVKKEYETAQHGKDVTPRKSTGAELPEDPRQDPNGLAAWVWSTGGLKDPKYAGEVRAAGENYGKAGRMPGETGEGAMRNLVDRESGGRTFEELASDLSQQRPDKFPDVDSALEYLVNEWSQGDRRTTTTRKTLEDSIAESDAASDLAEAEHWREQGEHLRDWGLEDTPEGGTQRAQAAAGRKPQVYENIEVGDVFYIHGDAKVPQGVYRVKANEATGTLQLVDGKKITIGDAQSVTGVRLGVIEPSKIRVGEKGRKRIQLRKGPAEPTALELQEKTWVIVRRGGTESPVGLEGPMTFEDARQWLSKNDPNGAYEMKDTRTTAQQKPTIEVKKPEPEKPEGKQEPLEVEVSEGEGGEPRLKVLPGGKKPPAPGETRVVKVGGVDVVEVRDAKTGNLVRLGPGDTYHLQDGTKIKIESIDARENTVDWKIESGEGGYYGRQPIERLSGGSWKPQLMVKVKKPGSRERLTVVEIKIRNLEQSNRTMSQNRSLDQYRQERDALESDLGIDNPRVGEEVRFDFDGKERTGHISEINKHYGHFVIRWNQPFKGHQGVTLYRKEFRRLTEEVEEGPIHSGRPIRKGDIFVHNRGSRHKVTGRLTVAGAEVEVIDSKGRNPISYRYRWHEFDRMERLEEPAEKPTEPKEPVQESTPSAEPTFKEVQEARKRLYEAEDSAAGGLDSRQRKGIQATVKKLAAAVKALEDRRSVERVKADMEQLVIERPSPDAEAKVKGEWGADLHDLHVELGHKIGLGEAKKFRDALLESHDLPTGMGSPPPGGKKGGSKPPRVRKPDEEPAEVPTAEVPQSVERSRIGVEEGEKVRTQRASKSGLIAEKIRPARGRNPRPSQIIRRMERAAYAIRRFGRIPLKFAAGVFQVHDRVIRLKTGYAGNMSVMAHEAGHAAQQLLFPEIGGYQFEYRGPNKAKVDMELLAAGKALYGDRRPPNGYKSEGFAEFTRIWITDRAQAMKQFPNFSKVFRERLMRDQHTVRMGLLMEQIGQDFRRWNELSASAKILSKLSIGEKVKVDRYTPRGAVEALFDDRVHLRKFTKDMFGQASNGWFGWMGLRRDAPHTGMNPYTTAWTAIGRVGGVVNTALFEGVPNIRINKKVAWLADKELLYDADVIAGKKPVWETSRGSKRGQPDVEAVSRFILTEVFEAGELEVRNTELGKHLYLTEKGREALTKERYEIIAPALMDILRRVSQPSKFTRPMAKREGGVKVIDAAANAVDVIRDKLAGVLDFDRTASYDNFRVYLVAKRAEYLLTERGIKATGLKLSDYKAAIKELETPEFKKALDDLQHYQRATLKWLVDEGLISKAEYKAILRLNKLYVPLNRLIESTSPGSRRGGGPKVTSPLRRIKGSDFDIIDPIESIIKDTYMIAEVVARNQSRRVFHEYAKSHPGSGWIAEEITQHRVPTRLKLSEIKKEIEAQFREAMEEAGIDETVIEETIDTLNLDVLGRVWRKASDLPAGENIVSYMKDGKQVWIKVPPEMERFFTGMDAHSANLAMQLMQVPARMLRVGATTHPGFIIKNLMKDSVSAAVFAKHGFIFGVDTLKGIVHLLRGDESVSRWQAAGGAHATYVSMDRAYMQYELRQMMKSGSKKEKIGQAMIHPIETLRALSELVENSTRLRVFEKAEAAENKRAPISGGTQDATIKAVIESRDSTLDFGSGGYASKRYNRYSAFFNAQMRGLDKSGRVLMEMADSPERAMQVSLRLLTYVTAPAVAAFLWNRNDPEYDGLSDFQKDFYLNVPLGRFGLKDIEGQPVPFLSLPVSHEIGVLFGSGVQRALHAIDKADGGLFWDHYAASVQDSIIPLALPTVLQAIMDNATNRTAFGGFPIEPDREIDLDAAMRFGPHTSETSKVLASWFRVMPVIGGLPRGEFKDREQVSPRNIDHILGQFSGGIGRHYAIPAIDWGITPILKAAAPAYSEKIGIGLRKQRAFWPKALENLGGSFMVSQEEVGRGTIDDFYEVYEKSLEKWTSFLQQTDADKARAYRDEPASKTIVALGDKAKAFFGELSNSDYIYMHKTLDRFRMELSAIHEAMRDPVLEGDRAKKVRLWKAAVRIAGEGLEAGREALKDPTRNEASWISYEERARSIEERGVRSGFRVQIEQLSEDYDPKKGLSDIYEWLRQIPVEHQSWAVEQFKRQIKGFGKTAADIELDKIPKMHKEKIRVRAKAQGE